MVHYRALRHLIRYIKGTSHKILKFYSDIKESPSYKALAENNITLDQDTSTTFSDFLWNDCVDTEKSTGGNISIMEGGPTNQSSHLPIPVAISSCKAEYIL